jgi:uncharacterized membrane protein
MPGVRANYGYSFNRFPDRWGSAASAANVPSRMKTPFTTEPGRLEAFSDGVLAVIITIMVLELKPPHGTDLAALRTIIPTFSAYALSFVYIGIYWNNHHHMLRACRGIDGRAMWMNLYLLFWLSLIPFTTSWLGENLSAPIPTAIYGAVLILSAIAFTTLQRALIAANVDDTAFAAAVKTDKKGLGTLAIYALGIAFAFIAPWISDALYITAALIWFIPDPRMENVILQHAGDTQARD